MSTKTETNVNELQVAIATLTEANVLFVAQIAALEVRIASLEVAVAPKNTAVKEMKDEDAVRILNGDLRTVKHNDVAKQTGFSYGQIYSCRLGFTFKSVHKQLAKIEGYTNYWVK